LHTYLGRVGPASVALQTKPTSNSTAEANF
jgi:hypothetical protein